jgi:hypothetical protein
LYFTFFGLQFNAKKSFGIGVEWFGDRYHCAQKLGYVPTIYNTEDYFEKELRPEKCRITERTKMATMHDGITYLGVQWSPMPHAVDHAYMKSLQAQVKDSVSRIKSMALRPGSIWYLLEAKLWSSIKWRIQYKTFTSKQLDELEKPARHLATTGAGLGKDLAIHLVHGSAERGGLGWHRWSDRVMAQRLLMVTAMLRTEGLLGDVIKEALVRTQEKAGSTANPLADPSLAEWDGPGMPGIMDELAIWMAQHDIKLEETMRVDIRAQGIAELFAGTASEQSVRRFCYLTDKRYVYQLLKEDGCTLCEQQLKDATGETPECGQQIRIRLGESGVGRGKLVAPQFRHRPGDMLRADRVQVGDSVLVKCDNGYRVGQVQAGGASAKVRWYDELKPSPPRRGTVKVYTQGGWEDGVVLPAARTRQTRFRVQLRSYSRDEPSGEVETPEPCHIDWRLPVHLQEPDYSTLLQSRLRLGDHCDELQWERVARVRTVSHGGKAHGDSLACTTHELQTLAHALQARGEALQQTPYIAAVTPAQAGFEAGGAVTQQMIHRIRDMLRSGRLNWNQETGEPERLRKNWDAFSDGSKKGIKGTYGWVANSPDGLKWGGGKCDLGWGGHDSFRTETFGLLSTMVSMWEHIPLQDTVTLWCDNLAVCKSYAKITRGTGRQRSSVDAWDEIEVWTRRWGGRFKIRWQRGHVERRTTNEADWTETEWGNRAADIIADDMYVSGEDSLVGALTQPTGWALVHGGLTAGEITIDILLRAIGDQDILEYAAEKGIGGEEYGSVDWHMTEAMVGWCGATQPQLRASNARRMWEQYQTRTQRARHGQSAGRLAKRGPKDKRHLTCLMGCGAQENLWHVLGVCRCAQGYVAARESMLREYNDCMQRPTKGDEGMRSIMRTQPAIQLNKFIQLRNGVWTPARRTHPHKKSIQLLLRGIAPHWLRDVFTSCGVTDEDMDAAARRHGEFVSGWVKNLWQTRKKELQQRFGERWWEPD